MPGHTPNDLATTCLKAGRHLSRRALLALALAGLPALAQAQAPAAPDLKNVTLRVGVFQEVTLLEVGQTPFFRDLPYKLEWAVLNGAGPTMQALGGRAIDLSWGLSDTAISKASAEDHAPWTAANAPLKWVALLEPVNAEKYPSGIIVANTKSGINSLADLRGRSYAYNEGGNAEARALLALHKAGLTKNDIKPRFLTNNALAAAVVSGAVDAAAPTYLTVADALHDGTVKLLATQEEVGFPGFTSITARVEALNEPGRGAAIADFLTRVTRFSEYRAQNLDEFAGAYVKAQQLKPEQALAAARSAATRVIPVGTADPAIAEQRKLLKLLETIGFLSKPIDAETLRDDRYSAAIAAGRTP